MTTRHPLTPQRRSGDCGLAALSTYCTIPYEDVYVAAIKVDPRLPKRGTTVTELIAVAKKLGRTFTRVHYRKVDLDEDEGVLGVTWNWTKSHGHWVVLMGGMIIDPGQNPATAMKAGEYLSAMDGRGGTLLTDWRNVQTNTR